MRSCGPSPRIPCNEADVVRLARLIGKKMAIKIKNKNEKIIKIIILERISYIAEKKLIIKTSPFFYEQFRLNNFVFFKKYLTSR